MKSLTLLSTLILACNAAPPLEGPAKALPLTAWQSAPQGERIIPRIAQQAPIDGGKRKEILYGPYAVAPGEMITTYEYNTDSPCQNCYVTGMDVSLKYLDGREAKTSEGAWLHHVVMTRGSYRLLSTALASISPGIIWGAANERPVLRLNGKWKYGIDWPDVFSFTLDIMSEQKEEMNVYLAVTFEYIEKESNMGKQYKASSMYWHQVGEPEPIPGTTTYRSTPWRSDVDAKLLHAAGHMHDGGTHLNLYINDRLICNSTQFYGKGAGHANMAGMESMKPKPRPAPASIEIMPPDVESASDLEKRDGPGVFGGDHITAPGVCTDFGEVRVGDIVRTESYYDFDIHKMMTHKGAPERIMGNMRVFMGPL